MPRTTPPIAGPTARAMLKATALSVTASATELCGTMSDTSAFHAGAPSARPSPAPIAPTMSTAGVTCFVQIAKPTSVATPACASCDHTTRCRRSTRSASTLAGSIATSDAVTNAVMSIDAESGLFVRSRMSPALADVLHERADVREHRREPERAKRRKRERGARAGGFWAAGFWPRAHAARSSTQRARMTVMLSGPPFSLARSIIFDAAILRSPWRVMISSISGSSTGPDRPSEQRM